MNAIQISSNNKAVIWDLDTNCELHFIVDTDTLIDPENFAVTGFKIEDVSEEENNPARQDKKFVLANHNNTIFSTPSSGTKKGQVFRLFTRLNLLQMIALHKQLRSGQFYRERIDLSVLTANIYG